MKQRASIIVTMAAYNAERTLEKTYNDIPPGLAEMVLVVDDASQDRTIEVARSLGLPSSSIPPTSGTAAIRRRAMTKRYGPELPSSFYSIPTTNTILRLSPRWWRRCWTGGPISRLAHALLVAGTPAEAVCRCSATSGTV